MNLFFVKRINFRAVYISSLAILVFALSSLPAFNQLIETADTFEPMPHIAGDDGSGYGNG
ncbi:MAG: hypothetical protein AAF702_25275 [Chloroflexota bacterium]